MKRLLPALPACAFLTTSARAEADPVADARAVLALVAADSIRGYRAPGAGLAWVQPPLSSSAFEQDRGRREQLRANQVRGIAPSQLRDIYEDIGHPDYDWRQTEVPAGAAAQPLLDPETRRLLNEAAGAAIRGEPGPRLLDRMESGWLDGVPFCGAHPRQPVLGFSAPVISGDFAFVETGYVCGGLCGGGQLYALRRG